MSAPATAPTGGDKNRATELLAVTWAEFTVSLALVALRFFTRLRITHNLWYDDWVILFTLVLAIVFSSLFTAYAHAGGARHVFYLDPYPAQKSHVLMLNWVSQAFCIFGFASGKISVALLIYRLQGPSKKRTWFLIFCAVSSLLFAIALVYSLLGQCSPPKALWVPGAGKCWDPKKVNDFDVAGGSYFAFIDIALSLTPITIVWNLQLSRIKKVMLSMLLGLGVFSGICAIVKTSYVPTLTAKSDFTWITVTLLIWNANEVNVIIWAACCPTLRPLFLQLVHKAKKKIPSSSGGYSRQQKSGYARHSSSEQLKLGAVGFKPSSRAGNNMGTDETLHEQPELLPLGRMRQTIDLDVKQEEALDGDRLGQGQFRSAFYARNIV